MGMRVIDGAAAMSEFQGFSGDCGETAELAGLHVIDPVKWPLDAATLDAIVKRDIGKGWASATGAEPLSSVAKDLAYTAVAFINHGYAEPLGYSWRAILDQWGGIRPVTLEVAVAGNLPGNEPGVRYHFITCLGWDPVAGKGLFANGDGSEARGGSLATYTAAELEAAKVCGALEITTPVKGWHEIGSGVPAGWTDDGATLRAPEPHSVGVVQGFRELVLKRPSGWWQELQPVAAAYGIGGANTRQDFALSTAWDGKALSLVPAPALVHASELEDAQKQIADLQAQIVALQQNAPTAAEAAALEAIRATARALAVEVEGQSSPT